MRTGLRLVQQPRLRLTRRGRIVCGLMATVLAAAVLAVIASLSGAQATASNEASTSEFGYIVLQPGESLWLLAQTIDPERDPRELVAELVRLNQLDGSGVQAGQAVALPLRYANSPGTLSAAQLGLDSAAQ